MTSHRLTRRTLVACALAAGALGALGTAQAQTKLKWAHVYEVSEPYHKWSVWAADEIKKRTNGRYEVQVFPASTLGKESDINQGLQLGTHVEGEGELEVGVAGVEGGAVVNDAGAVEQHVDARQPREQRDDRGVVEDVERRHADVGDAGVALEQRRVDVGGPDLRALGRQRQRAGPTDALSRGRDQRRLAVQSHGVSS